MGYITEFEVTSEYGFPEGFEEKFLEVTQYDFYDGMFERKWYDYQENMITLSKLYPDTLFEVDGDGEESGDVWKHYFKNGKDKKIQPEMRWPKFDESSL